MTAKQLFEGILIETNKINAPALKLIEFNHLVNKAINQWLNKLYNFYDVNQQTSDDLRVLKSTAYLTPTTPQISGISKQHHQNYVIFPMDYLHLLNCICIYELQSNKDCWDKGDVIAIPAKRLTADSWSNIIEDVYNRPTPLNPYYYIHNVNKQNELPTNIVTFENNKYLEGTDSVYIPELKEKKGEQETLVQEKVTKELPSTYSIKLPKKDKDTDYLVKDQSLIEKLAGTRHSNASQIRCEIRNGYDNSVFKLVEVQIDYIKSPQYIRLTQSQIDQTKDTSQVLEFPDYVIQEIMNELVYLIMERSGDPRLANTIQMTQTIARPTQQQAQTNNE